MRTNTSFRPQQYPPLHATQQNTHPVLCPPPYQCPRAVHPQTHHARNKQLQSPSDVHLHPVGVVRTTRRLCSLASRAATWPSHGSDVPL